MGQEVPLRDAMHRWKLHLRNDLGIDEINSIFDHFAFASLVSHMDARNRGLGPSAAGF